MIISPMVRSDVEEVHALVSSSFAGDLNPYMIVAQSGSALFLDSFVRHGDLLPDRCYLVARSSMGSLLGYADLRLSDDTSSFLSYIAVAPEARGKGVAGSILDRFLMDHPSVDSMSLDVFASNASARALYERRGFKVVEKSEWWVREPPELHHTPDGWELTNAADAAAWLHSFGFCEYHVSVGGTSRRFGQIGQETVKCYSATDFGDDEFLAAVCTLVPGVRRVFFIGSSELGQPTPDCVSVNTSLRMVCEPTRR